MAIQMSEHVPTKEQLDWKFVLAVLWWVCGLITGYLIGAGT